MDAYPRFAALWVTVGGVDVTARDADLGKRVVASRASCSRIELNVDLE